MNKKPLRLAKANSGLFYFKELNYAKMSNDPKQSQIKSIEIDFVDSKKQSECEHDFTFERCENEVLDDECSDAQNGKPRCWYEKMIRSINCE